MRLPGFGCAALAALTLALPSRAAEGDEDAEKAAQLAMARHLEGDSESATLILEAALKICEKSGCSPALLERLRAMDVQPRKDGGETSAPTEPTGEPPGSPAPAPATPAPATPAPAPPPPAALTPATPAPAPPAPATLVSVKPALKNRRPTWWIGPATQLDTVLLPGGDICGPESQSAARYACFRRDEEQYVGAPAPQDSLSTLAYGTTRVLLHAERSILPQLSASGRLGIAFGGGPSPAKGPAFMPLHMEARLAYWLAGGLDSDRPLGLFGLALGGVAQIDASRNITVRECQESTPGCQPAQNAQPGGPNPDRQELDAYAKLGQGFAGLGLGISYRFFEGSAAVADLRVLETFPTTGSVFSLSLAYVFRAP